MASSGSMPEDDFSRLLREFADEDEEGYHGR